MLPSTRLSLGACLEPDAVGGQDRSAPPRPCRRSCCPTRRRRCRRRSGRGRRYPSALESIRLPATRLSLVRIHRSTCRCPIAHDHVAGAGDRAADRVAAGPVLLSDAVDCDGQATVPLESVPIKLPAIRLPVLAGIIEVDLRSRRHRDHVPRRRHRAADRVAGRLDRDVARCDADRRCASTSSADVIAGDQSRRSRPRRPRPRCRRCCRR